MKDMHIFNKIMISVISTSQCEGFYLCIYFVLLLMCAHMVLYRTAYSFQLASTGICFYIFQSQITGPDSALCKEKQVKISGFYLFEIKF